jgi:hypothetical protein
MLNFQRVCQEAKGGNNGFCVENLTRKSCVSHYVSPRLCQKSTVAQSSNVAVENDPFVDDLPTKKVDVHIYVGLPQSICFI